MMLTLTGVHERSWVVSNLTVGNQQSDDSYERRLSQSQPRCQGRQGCVGFKIGKFAMHLPIVTEVPRGEASQLRCYFVRFPQSSFTLSNNVEDCSSNSLWLGFARFRVGVSRRRAGVSCCVGRRVARAAGTDRGFAPHPL